MRENTRCPQCQTAVLVPGIMPSELLLTTTFLAAVFNLILTLWEIPAYGGAIIRVIWYFLFVKDCVAMMRSAGPDWWRFTTNGVLYADVVVTAVILVLSCIQVGRFLRFGFVYRMDMACLVVGWRVIELWQWWRAVATGSDG